ERQPPGCLSFLTRLFLRFRRVRIFDHFAVDLGGRTRQQIGISSRFAGEVLLEFSKELVARFHCGFQSLIYRICDEEASGHAAQHTHAEALQPAVADISSHWMHKCKFRIDSAKNPVSDGNGAEAEDSTGRRADPDSGVNGL